MKRLSGWEDRLKAVTDKHAALPSVYGISDCYLIPDDAVEALTGERMFSDVVYSSELGAAKALKQHGFKTVADAFASLFEQIPPIMAQRGDIGVIDQNGLISGGVFTDIGFMTRDETKVIFLPFSQIKVAYKVAR